VTTVTIDRPPVNAMSAQVVVALESALDALAADPATRVALLRGAGERGFTAGADIAEFPALLQEGADAGGPATSQATNQRHGGHDARSGRHPVVGCQPSHLREIAHGGFARVVLPVGVGGEADPRVPGQCRVQGALAGRIERQELLQAQDGVEQQQAHAVEEQHGDAVDLPVVLLGGVNAADPVDQPLQRSQRRVKPGAPPFVDGGHVRAEWFGQQQQNDQVEDDLGDAGWCHRRFPQNCSGRRRATTR